MIVRKVDKIWLSNDEAQKYLGMSKDFLYNLRSEGLLHYYKLRGAVFYKKADIDRLVERHKVT